MESRFYALLNDTLNPEKKLAAEQALKYLEKDSLELFNGLFDIAMGNVGNETIRKLALIYLKNHIVKNWGSENLIINIEDRSKIRKVIIKNYPKYNKWQIENIKIIVKKIFESDWPEKWPEMVIEIEELIRGSSNSIHYIMEILGLVSDVIYGRKIEPKTIYLIRVIMNQHLQKFGTILQDFRHDNYPIKDSINYYGIISKIFRGLFYVDVPDKMTNFLGLYFQLLPKFFQQVNDNITNLETNELEKIIVYVFECIEIIIRKNEVLIPPIIIGPIIKFEAEIIKKNLLQNNWEFGLKIILLIGKIENGISEIINEHSNIMYYEIINPLIKLTNNNEISELIENSELYINQIFTSETDKMDTILEEIIKLSREKSFKIDGIVTSEIIKYFSKNLFDLIQTNYECLLDELSYLLRLAKISNFFISDSFQSQKDRLAFIFYLLNQLIPNLKNYRLGDLNYDTKKIYFFTQFYIFIYRNLNYINSDDKISIIKDLWKIEDDFIMIDFYRASLIITGKFWVSYYIIIGLIKYYKLNENSSYNNIDHYNTSLNIMEDKKRILTFFKHEYDQTLIQILISLGDLTKIRLLDYQSLLIFLSIFVKSIAEFNSEIIFSQKLKFLISNLIIGLNNNIEILGADLIISELYYSFIILITLPTVKLLTHHLEWPIEIVLKFGFLSLDESVKKFYKNSNLAVPNSGADLLLILLPFAKYRFEIFEMMFLASIHSIKQNVNNIDSHFSTFRFIVAFGYNSKIGSFDSFYISILEIIKALILNGKVQYALDIFESTFFNLSLNLKWEFATKASKFFMVWASEISTKDSLVCSIMVELLCTIVSFSDLSLMSQIFDYITKEDSYDLAISTDCVNLCISCIEKKPGIFKRIIEIFFNEKVFPADIKSFTILTTGYIIFSLNLTLDWQFTLNSFKRWNLNSKRLIYNSSTCYEGFTVITTIPLYHPNHKLTDLLFSKFSKFFLKNG